MKKKYYILIFLAVIIVYAFVQDWRLGSGKDLQKSNNETVVINGKQLQVKYMPKDSLYPAFGFASGNIAKVRDDLPPRIKRFVRAHELYHLGDNATWGGWVGQEIRANIIPGFIDPIGFASTAIASLSPTRFQFYWDRFINGGKITKLGN